MPKNKLCCRIFPIVLIIIAALISAGLWYFDEGVHEFRFLTHKGEFFNYLGTSLSIALLPIGLFYYLSGKEKYEDNARQLALLGFLPPVALLVILVI